MHLGWRCFCPAISRENFISEFVGCIEVMDNVFIGCNATILPNVRIGKNCIIGASSAVTKDLEPNGVYAGTPAKRIGSFDDYIQKCAENPEGGYNYPYIEHNQSISEGEIQRAWDFLIMREYDVI